MESKQIDAAFIWPNWPETFSFVAYEALQAGCLIITHPDSGNVFDAAKSMNKLIVFENFEDLVFDTDKSYIKIKSALVKNNKKHKSELFFSWNSIS